MLDRLKNVKEFEGNKQYVSELLAILMQSSTANQVKLAATNGIDALLSCVFPYKGRNARSDGEEEYVANLFGCLCSCLMPAENKVKFMQVRYAFLRLLWRHDDLSRHSLPCRIHCAANNSPVNMRQCCIIKH